MRDQPNQEAIGFRAQFLRRLRSGGRDESGAAAVFFSVFLILLAPLSLGLFDVYLASTQRTNLQDALDAATLFAARSTAKTSAQADAVGDAALTANLVLPTGSTVVASNFTLVGEKVVGYAEVSPPALAPGLWPHPNVKANSEVVRSLDRLEIALVLDNTGSMEGTKLTTLKSAANSLVDKLVVAAARSADPTPLKIALVPFSMTVRVQGTTSLTAYNTTTKSGVGIPTWLDQEAKEAVIDGVDNFNVQSDRFALMKKMGVSWEGCVESRPPPYDVQETAPTTGTVPTMFVPFFWPDEPDESAGFDNFTNDYLNDGGKKKDSWLVRQKNAAKYTKAPKSGQWDDGYTYGPNMGCSLQPMVRLTTNTASIKTAVNNMVAVGATNIPMGMMWGWHSLSPNTPLADGSAYGTTRLRKIIILMTDGENTMGDPGSDNESYYSGLGYIWQGLLGITSGTSSQRTTKMDERLTTLCTNIKGKDITIYTVRVEVTSGSSTVLKNCASTADKFYDVQDVSQLNDAFDAIAASIDNLRLAK